MTGIWCLFYQPWDFSQRCKWSSKYVVKNAQFSPQDDLKVIARLSTSPRLFDDAAALEPLIANAEWQTLVTIAKESGGMQELYTGCLTLTRFLKLLLVLLPPCPRVQPLMTLKYHQRCMMICRRMFAVLYASCAVV